MPYIEGKSLDDMIEEGPMRLDEVTDLATQVCHGLQEAHKRGIVHRDIKPANIMITNSGQAKIMDFGLARQTGMTRLTQEGMTLGTIAYMSPEQATGAEIDRRTDIWAVGVVIYQMVTGRLPFESDYEQATIYSIINGDPEPLTALRTGVPMELERIVDKAMEKNKEERYQHIDEMLVDLQRLKRDTGKMSRKTAREMTMVGSFVPPESRKSAGARVPSSASSPQAVSGVTSALEKERSIAKFFMANLTEGLAILISVALDFYIVANAIFAAVTWLSLNLYEPLVDFVSTICEPFLGVITGILPESLGLDISPVIAIGLTYLTKKILAEPLLQLSNRFRRAWQRS